METEKIYNDIKNLPPDAQRQVFDFIDFIKKRYKPSPKKKQSRKINFASESFIGIWKDREDIKDSSTWLRSIRKTEWG